MRYKSEICFCVMEKDSGSQEERLFIHKLTLFAPSKLVGVF
jgi:hypothetical protein